MKFQPILGRAGGMCGVLGREKERGSEACWDRILEKNIFYANTLDAAIEESPCPVESSTLVPGGAADRFAHSAGPY